MSGMHRGVSWITVRVRGQFASAGISSSITVQYTSSSYIAAHIFIFQNLPVSADTSALMSRYEATLKDPMPVLSDVHHLGGCHGCYVFLKGTRTLTAYFHVFRMLFPGIGDPVTCTGRSSARKFYL